MVNCHYSHLFLQLISFHLPVLEDLFNTSFCIMVKQSNENPANSDTVRGESYRKVRVGLSRYNGQVLLATQALNLNWLVAIIRLDLLLL